MKQVTNSFKNNIKKYGRQLDAIITFGNTTISKENINSIIPSFNTTLFKSVMQAIEIDSNIKIEKGTKINVKVGVGFNNSAYEYIEYNNYKTQDPEKQEDTESYKIIAYDRMIESMIDYDLQITKKITVREYLIKIFERLNWPTTDIPDVFVNSEKKIDPSVHVGIGYTFRDVLDELATITGSFIFIKNSIPTLAYITDTEEKIDEEYLSEDDVTIGSKYIINSLVFSRAEESDNIYRKDDISIEENGLYEFKISDNQILSTNDRVDFIEDLFNYLKTIQFYIFDIKSPGIMWFELVDMFNICVHGGEYPVVLLNDEITVDQDLEEKLYADEPDESTTEYKYADETDKKINQAYIVVDKQNQKITQLTSQVTENQEKISKIEQDVDGIRQKVDNVQDFTNTVSGNYQLILSNAEAFPVLKLIMYGKSRDPLYLYPNSKLFPSSLLTTQGEYNKITLVIDSQSRIDPSENVREYVFKIEEQLNDYNEIHDQLVIERNVDTNLCEVKVLRYIQREGKIITVLKDPIEETVGSFEIELLEGKNYVYIKEYPHWKIDCKYLVQNDANDLYATKVEMHSSIEQTAEEINLEVRKKVDENEIISKINQSAERISIEAEKININGVVSANDNFKIDKNGNMTCNNGTFKGGKINLSGGTKENPTFWIEDDSGNRAYFTPSGFGVGGSTNYFEFNPYNILINLDGLNWNFNRDSQRTITDNDLYVLADIHAYSYLYDSLEEKKRDITQFTDKALDIVKNGELYSFNYKGEKEETKKHIGFIIGENYKTPKEVMSTNNQAIDAYTMTSILWKAVQEQQETIEELQNEIKQMKERK